jgi:hypothetical protein
MKAAVQDYLKDYVEVLSLAVISTTIPTVIQNAIQDTVSAQQTVYKTASDNSVARESAETVKQKAVMDATVVRLQSEALANITLANAQGQAQITTLSLGAEAAAYETFANTYANITGFTFTPGDLLTHIWIQTVVSSGGNASVTLNLDMNKNIQGFDYTKTT